MESGFEAVWSRVTGGSVQDNADATLDNWIREEARGIRVYETLLRSRLPDPVRKTFRQILNIKHRQLKQLQVMVFLRTGDTIAVLNDDESAPASLPHGLRERYRSEVEQAARYRLFQTKQPDLTALSTQLAEEDERIAQRLRILMTGLF